MTYASAIHEPCRRCKAQAGFECVNPLTDQPARFPCVTRYLGRPVAAPPKDKRNRRA